jgi:hypothetical protein
MDQVHAAQFDTPSFMRELTTCSEAIVKVIRAYLNSREHTDKFEFKPVSGNIIWRQFIGSGRFKP